MKTGVDVEAENIAPAASQTQDTETSQATYLEQALWSRLADAASPEAYAAAWLQIQCRIVEDARSAVVVLGAAGQEGFSPVAHWPDESAVSPALTDTAERAFAERKGVARAGKDSVVEGADAVAYPVLVDGQVYGVVAMEVGHRSDQALRTVMRQLQWGCAWLEAMVRRKVFATRDQLTTVLDLVTISLEHRRFQAAASALATELSRVFSCEWVSVGFRRGTRTRVRALSHSATFAEKANLIRAMESAMDEAMDQQLAVVYPPPSGTPAQASRAHARLADVSEAGGLCTVPLSDDDQLLGALTMQRPSGHNFDAKEVELVRYVALLAGPVLELKRREDRWIPGKAWESLVRLLGRLFGPRHLGLKFSTLAAIALGLFLYFAEGEYRVSADAALEGVVQRAVTAPMDGYIADAPVRAGDIVSSGDLLVALEDKEIQLERVKWASQREQRQREYAKALSDRQRAQVRILGAQIEQADSQIALLDDQLARVRIAAPFDGVVVSGDLSQQLNAPVERGQVLFEVAPLNDYRVILKVDEQQISQVAVGQLGEVGLTGFPGDPLPMVVEKITPVSVAEEGRNYFRVEGRLEEVTPALRPGMEGVGKIGVERRRLVWIWTRELVHWLRLWLWSWWP